MPHARFTLSISCLPLSFSPMSVPPGHLLPYLKFHVPYLQYFTLSISCLLLCFCPMSVTLGPFVVSVVQYAMPHVSFTLSISCLLLCCCPMYVAPGPFAISLVMPCPMPHGCGTWPFPALLEMPFPMSVSLCPSALYYYVAVPCTVQYVALSHFLPYLKCHALCLFLVHQLSTVMLLPHVCGTWSICCLTGNAMSHVRFTLSISCLLLCYFPTSVAIGLLLPYLKCHSSCLQYFTLFISCLLLCCCPMFVALGLFSVSLVMPCPTSVSFSPTAVYCYVVAPCRSTRPFSAFLEMYHVPSPFHSVQRLSTELCCCPMNVAFGPFVFSLALPCPMFVLLCLTAVYCYVTVPCLWHSDICCLPGKAMPHVFHFGHQLSSIMLPHLCGTQSICCISLNAMPRVHFTLPNICLLYVVVSCLWHSVHLLPYLKCHSPMSVSLCPFVYCYVAVPWMWHVVHLWSQL